MKAPYYQRHVFGRSFGKKKPDNVDFSVQSRRSPENLCWETACAVWSHSTLNNLPGLYKACVCVHAHPCVFVCVCVCVDRNGVLRSRHPNLIPSPLSSGTRQTAASHSEECVTALRRSSISCFGQFCGRGWKRGVAQCIYSLMGVSFF